MIMAVTEKENYNPLILITGGARSGKSSYGENYALSKAGQVIYIATADGGDQEMQERIKIHQSRRPDNFITREETLYPHRVLADKQEEGGCAYLLDCLTILLSNHLFREGIDGDDDEEEKADGLSRATGEADKKDADNNYFLLEKRSRQALSYLEVLVKQIKKQDAPFLVVTNEVGMGLVPGNLLGRVFRDLAGRANQLMAREAREVWFMVSGIPWRIK